MTRAQVTHDEAKTALTETLGRLRALKRNVATLGAEEEEQLRCTRLRLLGGEGCSGPDGGAMATTADGGGRDSVNQDVLDELLVDYMLRLPPGERGSEGQPPLEEGCLDAVALELQ